MAAEVEALGRRVLRVQMDVLDLGQIRAAVDEVARTFGRLDILVNNAGTGPENPAEHVREEDFDLTVAVNLKGVFFASQAAGAVMIGQGAGRIVNLSSQAGFVALPGESVYCMTKAGVAHLTKCLAVEWGRFGITVNAVAPTFIRTPGTEKRPGRSCLRGRRHRPHRRAAPHRGTDGRRGGGRLSVLPGRRPGDRCHAPHRRRLDGALTGANAAGASPLSATGR